MEVSSWVSPIGAAPSDLAPRMAVALTCSPTGPAGVLGWVRWGCVTALGVERVGCIGPWFLRLLGGIGCSVFRRLGWNWTPGV